MKRITLFIFLLFMLILCFRKDCYASNLGPIYVWNSGDSTIGRFDITNPSLYKWNLSSNSGFTFSTSIDNAISCWNTALGTSIHLLSSPAANIIAYGGTRTQLSERGYDYDLTIDGYFYPTKSYEGYWMYNNVTPRSSYRVTSAVLCVVDNTGTSNYSNYTKASLHELGHVLGWFGHSPNSNDIMYSLTTPTNTLTNRDKTHLSQVY